MERFPPIPRQKKKTHRKTLQYPEKEKEKSVKGGLTLLITLLPAKLGARMPIAWRVYPTRGPDIDSLCQGSGEGPAAGAIVIGPLWSRYNKYLSTIGILKLSCDGTVNHL